MAIVAERSPSAPGKKVTSMVQFAPDVRTTVLTPSPGQPVAGVTT